MHFTPTTSVAKGSHVQFPLGHENRGLGGASELEAIRPSYMALLRLYGMSPSVAGQILPEAFGEADR
jgi:hypothetical protein